jgi:glycosyltransferase involved in cell wall biosynthesis
MPLPVDLVHYHRLPGPGHVSIERLFEEIRRNLPEPWQARVVTCPYPSRGIVPRLRSMNAARRHAGRINHITGDVHFLAMALPAGGTVLTIHDCALLKILKGPAREFIRNLWFTAPGQCSRIVTTISTTMSAEIAMLAGVDLEKMRVVPNCVRGEFSSVPKPFPSRDPVILQVGTGWNKNLEGVARALRGLECRLVIVGEPSRNQREFLEIQGIPYTALGRVSDEAVRDAYIHCDMVVFASLYEGFGLPIIEAQAVGRPVITSNFGAMAEAAGKGAYLVNPLDPGEIRRAILRIKADPDLRHDLMAKGFENVSRYSPEAVAKAYAAIYEEVAESLSLNDRMLKS